MTAREAFISVAGSLKSANIAEPEAKAREIVAHALRIDYADIFFYQSVQPQDLEAINAMALRCTRGEPVQYVTGKTYFRHVTLNVSPDVLIPRKETELTAQKAIDIISARGFQTVLDLCTGSGCIAISIATETSATVEACDVSEKALKLARQNALISSAAVRFFASNMFSEVNRTYDLIVSNPPYVSEKEYETLSADVHDFEPYLALVAGDEGYAFYRLIAREAALHINEGGMIVLEIGARQAALVTALLAADFTEIECYKDYEGRDRIVTARKKQDVLCLKNWMNIKEDSHSLRVN